MFQTTNQVWTRGWKKNSLSTAHCFLAQAGFQDAGDLEKEKNIQRLCHKNGGAFFFRDEIWRWNLWDCGMLIQIWDILKAFDVGGLLTQLKGVLLGLTLGLLKLIACSNWMFDLGIGSSLVHASNTPPGHSISSCSRMAQLDCKEPPSLIHTYSWSHPFPSHLKMYGGFLRFPDIGVPPSYP